MMKNSKINEKIAKKRIDNQTKILNNLKDVKHKIIILSGKGGVGKSTVAANLAFSLGSRGAQVGLIDADMHGPSIPKMLGIENERLVGGDDNKIMPVTISPNIKVVSMAFLIANKDMPVIWRGPLKMHAIRQFLEDVQWGSLDYLIIDIPDSDGAIIVTTPQDVALLSVRKSINFVKTLKLPVIGIIENMSGFICPHCNKKIDIFGTGGGLKASRDFNVPFLGKIPIAPEIVETGDSGKPFVLEHRGSSSTKAFEEIVEKIEKILDKK
jgi:Mrp family chromosome partitioning ATPase